MASGYIENVTEAALEPDLPICDPHHHLWDHPGHRYMLEELRADTGTGHNVTDERVRRVRVGLAHRWSRAVPAGRGDRIRGRRGRPQRGVAPLPVR